MADYLKQEKHFRQSTTFGREIKRQAQNTGAYNFICLNFRLGPKMSPILKRIDVKDSGHTSVSERDSPLLGQL